MPNTYNVGDNARLRGTFRNLQSGANIDPDVVTLHYRLDANTPVVLSGVDITRIALGIYEAIIPCVTAGVIEYYWRSTGSGSATSIVSTFTVVDLPF